MQWKRIAIYAIALFLAAQAIALLYGLSLNWWLSNSSDVPQTLENVRLARRFTIAVVAFAIYLVFFSRIRARLPAHAASIFLLVELLNVLLELALTHSFSDVVDWPYSTAHFILFVLALLASQFLRRAKSDLDVGMQR